MPRESLLASLSRCPSCAVLRCGPQAHSWFLGSVSICVSPSVSSSSASLHFGLSHVELVAPPGWQ